MSRAARRVEKKFLSLLDDWSHPVDGSQWQDATPGFLLQAWKGGRLQIDVACGKTSKIYDWASLTKIVLSVSSAMIETDEGRLSVSDPILNWLPELSNPRSPQNLSHPRSPLSSLKIRDLLTHSAGMSWWQPFYKKVSTRHPQNHEEAWGFLFDLVAKNVRERSKNGEIRKAMRGRSVYSDLDFFLFGEILRRSSLKSFASQFGEVRDRLGLRSTYFHSLVKSDLQFTENRESVLWNRDRRSSTAPTEFDRTWRKRLLQSEVHDENASSLKGIAPHAGLFGPIEDLSIYGLELRRLYYEKKSGLPASGRKFVSRAVPRSKGDWAMGFMMPTRGAASCGPRFSPLSLGHTGFTGTSLWFDPKSDLLVSILSNRVHPTRTNSRFVQLRPALHTFVVDALSL